MDVVNAPQPPFHRGGRTHIRSNVHGVRERVAEMQWRAQDGDICEIDQEYAVTRMMRAQQLEERDVSRVVWRQLSDRVGDFAELDAGK
eukprot:7385669-Prymnesium_polylepis.1